MSACELAVSPTCPNINNKRALEVNDTNQSDRNNLHHQQQQQQGGAASAPSADAAAAVVVGAAVVSKRRRGGGGANAGRCFVQEAAAAASTPSYAAGPTTLSALRALFPEMAEQVRRERGGLFSFFALFFSMPPLLLRSFVAFSEPLPPSLPLYPQPQPPRTNSLRTSPTCSTRAATTSTPPCADSPSSG